MSAVLRAEGGLPSADRLLRDQVCSMGAKPLKHALNRAERPRISLSPDLLIQLVGGVTSLIPSFSQRGQIGIGKMVCMGTTASLAGWSCFLFQDAIDTATTDPDDLRDRLFVMPRPTQLPDPRTRAPPAGDGGGFAPVRRSEQQGSQVEAGAFLHSGVLPF
jgi:hypothetical protein